MAKRTYTEMNQPLKLKGDIYDINEPFFSNMLYCVKQSTSMTLLTFDVEDMYKIICDYSDFMEKNIVDHKNENKFTYIICQTHGLNIEPVVDCNQCVSFETFTYTFTLISKFDKYTFPPPCIYQSKNFNYFHSFVRKATTNKTVKTDIGCANSNVDEHRFYNYFIGLDFKGGKLKNIIAGKNSFIRNKIIGFQTTALRGTITIDSTLGPNYMSIPQNIYRKLDLATSLALVNRAPSINDTCLYCVELIENVDENDYTPHLNSFLTEGLHADQDGDEVVIYTFPRTDTNIKMIASILELKRFSWKYGDRHNISYTPRYAFTQYHHFLIHCYDDFLAANCPIWKAQRGTTKERLKKIMDLGCSIAIDEVDTFIKLVLSLTINLDVFTTNTYDILNGCGDIEKVVKSGAKGSMAHIDAYLQNLYNTQSEESIKTELINSFTKYVNASSNMSVAGFKQFKLLYAMNPITYHMNHVYYGDKVIIKDSSSSSLMATFMYNETAVNYTVEKINKLIDVSDEEIDKVMMEFI